MLGFRESANFSNCSRVTTVLQLEDGVLFASLLEASELELAALPVDWSHTPSIVITGASAGSLDFSAIVFEAFGMSSSSSTRPAGFPSFCCSLVSSEALDEEVACWEEAAESLLSELGAGAWLCAISKEEKSSRTRPRKYIYSKPPRLSTVREHVGILAHTSGIFGPTVFL